MDLPPPSPFARHWRLDPDVVFLNHGSFGACPVAVLEAQHEWRQRMEREPVRFLHRELETHLDAARERLAGFLRADADDLAFVANATVGVNTILRSLTLAAGDEVVTTNHEYNACRNALDDVVAKAGARVVQAQIGFPGCTREQVIEAVTGALSPRTRLVLIDHVTSPTGLVLPVGEVIAIARARGIEILVDGAHAPGMLDLDLRRLGATYYTGNCHKWLCAPKGAAFLWVRRDRQPGVRPLVISHGANSPRADRSRFRLEFDFTGTGDYTPFLTVPTALDAMAGMLPGGFTELRAHNHALVRYGRNLLCDTLGITVPAPDAMLGSLAAVPLPDAALPPVPPHGLDTLQVRLFAEHRIEVPVPSWPARPRRLLRISAQIYNSKAQYDHLARALAANLARASR